MEKLKTIHSPADLRGLSLEELKEICSELRSYIMEVVEEKGGHFASPLGVVELTVALHKVFDTPEDKLIWDVGHQAYAHKIITGRRESFPTLRQDGGISGYLRREESEYDVFGAGHASTSISAGVGIAEARKLKGSSERIVAIIGDGAMTGGLAYEGLNNATQIKGQFLIVLNDNQMSISPTVGALSHYLTKVVTKPLYNRVRDEIWRITGKLPKISGAVRRFLHTLQEGLKSFLVPGIIFEELGIRYFGPIDGQNMDELIVTLENLKDFPHPVVLHVLTKKGAGHKEAELDSLKWYSMSGKPSDNGQEFPAAPDYSKVAGKIACEMAERDEKVCAVVAAMREGTGLTEFHDRFPERFFDAGIAEGHAVTFAAGLSISGMKPLVAIYSTFLQRSYDMIIHDVALQNLPVIFALDRAGVVGPDGPTHHGVFDLAYLRMIPGLTVAAPKNGNELRHLLMTALEKSEGPFAVRYPKASSVEFDENGSPEILEIGSWEIVQPGSGMTILAVGSMVSEAEKALTLLDGKYLPQIVNARFIKPLDEKLLRQLMNDFEAILTIEEGVLSGGFGSAVLTWLNEHGYEGHFQRLGIPDEFVQHGSRESLLYQIQLTAEGIADRIRGIFIDTRVGVTI
ncbi:MAG: 1-deoxy-D-xylulose-5-phosphate synthase [Fidelibacterota bacterium]